MLAIRSDWLIPGGGHPSIAPALVLVEGGVIISVQAAGASLPDHIEFVDLAGTTLLPGLVDSHVHLCFSDGDLMASAATHDATSLALMHANASRHLAAGVTTVRDLGDRGFLGLELRRSYESGQRFGPELLVSGPPITRSRGHFWFLGGEANTAKEVRLAVAERADRGCDVVKIMTTGGFVTPGFGPHQSQYGPKELHAAAEEAHLRGLPLAAHAHGRQGILDSVAAGADTVEHCSFFNGERVEVDWDVVEDLVKRDVLVGLTLAMSADVPTTNPLAAHIAEVAANLPGLRQAGLKVVCSSDAGVSPHRPHGVLPNGIITLARHGFTNVEALDAATSVAADACGLGQRKGRVAPGFDADLLAVDGNPLEDIKAILSVRAVFRSGVRVL